MMDSDMTLPAAPNPSVALARVFIDELVRNGVRQFVLAPGSRSAALAMAAASHPGVTLHVEIDERSAGFLAVGIAKASDRPAAVITTSGTAVANLHPAVIEADLSMTPLIVLSADRPPELRHAGANQTIDQVKLFGPNVRWFCDVGVPENRGDSNRYWRATVCRGVADALGQAGPPGPVHLNLAFREPLVPSTDDGRSVAEPFTHSVDGRPGGRPWTDRHADPQGIPVMALPEDIAGNERGVVTVGSSRWARSAAILAEYLGWPLLAEATSGVREQGSITTAHHLLSHPGWAGSHAAQVAVAFGSSPLSQALAEYLRRVDRLVVVDPDRWRDPERRATDILNAVPVSARTEPAAPGTWFQAWEEAEQVARSALDSALDAHDRLSEPRIARDAARAVPDCGHLVVGSSMPVRDLDWFMGPHRMKVYSNRGASGIDGFVSTALGVAVGAEQPVVALAGDLSMLHDHNGFLVDSRPDCVFVIVNNDGGGIFSFLPQAAYPRDFERVFGTPRGRSFENLAQFHALGYHHVDRAADLIGLVEAATAAGGVHLVEASTERPTNVTIHRQIGVEVHAALDSLV